MAVSFAWGLLHEIYNIKHGVFSPPGRFRGPSNRVQAKAKSFDLNLLGGTWDDSGARASANISASARASCPVRMRGIEAVQVSRHSITRDTKALLG